MIKKQAVVFGAIIGVFVGIIVFAVGIHSTPDMFILRAINAVQTPLIPVAGWLQGASHNWGNNNSGLYKLLLLLMAYWMLIGAMLGLGLRLTCSRRGDDLLNR